MACTWAGLACCWLAPGLAIAGNELVQIDEVLVGANGNSMIQFIELKIADASQTEWGPQGAETVGRVGLVFFDARDVRVNDYIFLSDPTFGPEDPEHGGASVLVATLEFTALPGVPAPDFIIPAHLFAEGGKVCFKDNPDNPDADDVNLCFSYGNFVGDTEADNQGQSAGAAADALHITGALGMQRFANFDNYGAGQFNADFLSATPAPRNSAGHTGTIDVISPTEQGEILFTREGFLGNGRTCATCHRREIGFGLSPALIEQIPDDDPLFVAQNNPGLEELENTCLLVGPRGLNLENIDGFENPPVFRGSPHLLNIGLTAPYSLSGGVSDLRSFAMGAVMQHLPRTLARNADPELGTMDFRLPTDAELVAMEEFMQSIAIPADGDLDLDRMIEAAVARGADEAQIEAGREVFFDTAKCFTCHGGSTLAIADDDLGGGNQSFNTGVVNLEINDFDECLGGPLPAEDDGNREFSTPPLVGVAVTGPFFHDNSVETLDEAIAFYNDEEFQESPGGQLVGGISLSMQNVFDITAFLEALREPVNPVINVTQETAFLSIQSAVDVAVDGDEIVVAPGVYAERIDYLDKDIVLRSSDPMDWAVVAETIIDGGGLDTCVRLDAGTLSGFTIRNGGNTGLLAGGVEAGGTAVVSHNRIMHNHAAVAGGGIAAHDDVMVRNNIIMLNTAATRAGGVNARDNSQIIDNMILFNTADSGGGGVRARESAVIRNNTLAYNGSPEVGTGVLGGGGILAEDTSTLLNNIIASSFEGSGIHIANDEGVQADFNCVFGNAGGNYSGEASPGINDISTDPLLNLDKMHLSDPSPCINAGQIDFVPLTDETDIDGEERVLEGRVDIGADEVDELTDCNSNGIDDGQDISEGTSADCDGNTVPDECQPALVHNLTQGTDYPTIQCGIDGAQPADEIEVDPGVYLENLSFLDKDITVRSVDPLDPATVEATIIDGGGFTTVVTLSAGVISGFTITGGAQTGTNAGGVHATGTAAISYNIITGNVADTNGGGVIARDTAVVHNNRIVSNSAAELGGGVSARDDSLVINNYIAFNSAQFGGGGLRTRESPTIRNNTIVFNSSADAGPDMLGGGGILASNSPLILNNVIAFSADGVGFHSNASDGASANYNCIFGNVDGEYSDEAIPGPNDLSVDPALDDDELHLLSSSPCIDAGDPLLDPLPDETDIDNQERILNDRVDIGCDEFAICEGDANGDGTVDPLDAGFVLARFGCPVGGGDPNCDIADQNGDGSVDPLDTGFVLARFGDCD